MKLTKVSIAIAAVTVLALDLRADQNSYNHPSTGSLKGTCMSEKIADEMFCLGYVSGWEATYAAAAYPIGLEGERIVFRFQDGVTYGQIKRMFIKYVEEHPETENQSAAQVLIQAPRPVVEYMVLDKDSKPKAGAVWKAVSSN